MMNKDLVIFDIDGTLLKEQSQKLFLDFLYKNSYISFFYYLKISLWFLLYKSGLIENPKPIMEYAFGFLKNKTISEISEIVDYFFDNILKNKFKIEIVEILNKHKEEGRDIILVSNAVDILVKKIASYFAIENFLATKLEIVDGRYTSNIVGEIMYGENKLVAINEYILERHLDKNNIWVYTDHHSDLPILLISKFPNAVNPTKKLQKIASMKKWPIIKFKEI